MCALHPRQDGAVLWACKKAAQAQLRRTSAPTRVVRALSNGAHQGHQGAGGAHRREALRTAGRKLARTVPPIPHGPGAGGAKDAATVVSIHSTFDPPRPAKLCCDLPLSTAPCRCTGLASNTPLMLSIFHDHEECAKLMITNGTDLEVHCGPDLETPLHVCCARGNAVITKALVDAKANCCATDAHGRSPLLVACMEDQPECAAVLLAAGAELEQPMAGGAAAPGPHGPHSATHRPRGHGAPLPTRRQPRRDAALRRRLRGLVPLRGAHVRGGRKGQCPHRQRRLAAPRRRAGAAAAPRPEHTSPHRDPRPCPSPPQPCQHGPRASERRRRGTWR